MPDRVSGTLCGLRGEEKNKLNRMLRMEVASSEEGYTISGAQRCFLYL
jgi:hypothetical protein